MSWMQSLVQTYDNCRSLIGVDTGNANAPLLPICHTTQMAQIEIVLDARGNFRRAAVVSKKAARTIIPCTEDSGGRTSGPVAHPLCDKLQYVAADYTAFGGEKDHQIELYLAELGKWVNNGAPQKVGLVYAYVKRGRVIADLVKHGILFTDRGGQLFKQRPDKKADGASLDIFDVLPGRMDPNGKITLWQGEAFVRWLVEIPGEPVAAVWADPKIRQSWITHYSATKQKKSICYVTGQEDFVADKSPAKLRSDGDKAKLISSNDGDGFTYRGRFTAADQAVTVGFLSMQKAHNALRWLVARQGYNRHGIAIVAWAKSGRPILQPTDDASTLLWGAAPVEEAQAAYTAQELGIKLTKRIAGYGKEIGNARDVAIIALDAATIGRMSIIYYCDLAGSDYLDRIDGWHRSCAWLHEYGEIKNEQTGKTARHIQFVGAPAPTDIAEATYGNRVDDRQRNSTILRLLPCIIDGQPIPRDLVELAIRRASNRVGIKSPDDRKYHGDDEYTWHKTLSIACALYRKYRQGKETYDMSLDPTRKTRDYLYGRLLAIADHLEEQALKENGQSRATNAERYMQQFSQRPYRTWAQIYNSLAPYMGTNGSRYYKGLIAEVGALFESDDFSSNKPLSGEYLLGYYCQRQKLWEKRVKPDPTTDEISYGVN